MSRSQIMSNYKWLLIRWEIGRPKLVFVKFNFFFTIFCWVFKLISFASCTFRFPGTCVYCFNECASWMSYPLWNSHSFLFHFFLHFFLNKILLLWWTICEWWRMFSVCMMSSPECLCVWNDEWYVCVYVQCWSGCSCSCVLYLYALCS